jgi:hypothetical protein
VSNQFQVSRGYHLGIGSLFVLLHLTVFAVFFVPATPHLMMWLRLPIAYERSGSLRGTTAISATAVTGWGGSHNS